jgi:hypothetical protein
VIAGLVLAGATLALGPQEMLRAWYLQGDATRTQATYRLEYREDSPGHNHSYDNEREVALRTLATTFSGMTVDQLYSSGTHVHFENRRDAGTIVGDGWAANGNASGSFTVSLDPNFVRELQRRGIGTISADQQEQLTLEDVSYALLDTLKRYGYATPTVSDLVRLVNHGVTIDYVREMHDAGFAPTSTGELVRAMDHGVTPSYVAGLRARGVNGSLDDFVRAVDHGVTLDEVNGFIGLGYKGLTLEQLIKLSDHGVTVAFVNRLRGQGYANLSIEDLIRLRDHGV